MEHKYEAFVIENSTRSSYVLFQFIGVKHGHTKFKHQQKGRLAANRIRDKPQTKTTDVLPVSLYYKFPSVKSSDKNLSFLRYFIYKGCFMDIV